MSCFYFTNLKTILNIDINYNFFMKNKIMFLQNLMIRNKLKLDITKMNIISKR